MTDEQTFADYRSRLNIKDVLETQATRFTSVMACAILRMYAWAATEKESVETSTLSCPTKTAVSSRQPSSSTLLPPSSGNIQTFSRSTSMA